MYPSKNISLFHSTVIVSSIGYFVDIYDLILFSIVRIPSLRSIGIPDDELMSKGVTLLNLQMGGMLIGGLLWGILGDKRGRVSVLYGSILLYSLANIANAFVTSFEAYAAFRLIAGIGLAGELGAAVTLVSELLPANRRGFGVALVASIGILGAIFAAFVSELFSWQIAYLVGGGMGLLLLALRVKMHDSNLFSEVRHDVSIKKGNFFMFFETKERLLRYMACIFIGAPSWFIIGVLVAFSPEITATLNPTEPIVVGTCIAWLYLGLSIGDLASGLLSQWIKSRKRAVKFFLLASLPLIWLYLTKTGASPTFYYSLFFGLGISNGYWAVMLMMAAEQFGTNMRATATTTVSNFIRAMVIPMSIGVQLMQGQLGLIYAVSVVGVFFLGAAIVSLTFLEETCDKDLNFLELESAV